MSEFEDPEIVAELRAEIRGGKSAVDGIRFLLDRLRLGPDSRLVVIVYFRKAFFLTIREAKVLGAWDFFPQAAWTEEAVNEEVGPGLARYLEGRAEEPEW